MIINLTEEEIEIAKNGGKSRMNRVLKENLSFQKGQYEHRKGYHLKDHLCGAVAEYAFFKHLGKEWSPTLNSVDHGDLDKYEIKSTHLKNGNLIIPSTYSSSFNFTFVFCVVSKDYKQVEIKGCIDGKKAISDKYWNPKFKRPCWFVPVSELEPFSISDETN